MRIFFSIQQLLAVVYIFSHENTVFAVLKTNFTQVQDHDFIRNHFLGIGKDSALLGWVVSYRTLYNQVNLPV